MQALDSSQVSVTFQPWPFTPKMCIFPFLCVAHVPSANLEELWFMINTAASHQGAMGLFGSLLGSRHVSSWFTVSHTSHSFHQAAAAVAILRPDIQYENVLCDLRPSRLQLPPPPPCVAALKEQPGAGAEYKWRRRIKSTSAATLWWQRGKWPKSRPAFWLLLIKSW